MKRRNIIKSLIAVPAAAAIAIPTAVANATTPQLKTQSVKQTGLQLHSEFNRTIVDTARDAKLEIVKPLANRETVSLDLSRAAQCSPRKRKQLLAEFESTIRSATSSRPRNYELVFSDGSKIAYGFKPMSN